MPQSAQCTDPATGSKLRLFCLGEIEIEDDNERRRLLLHGTECKPCRDILLEQKAEHGKPFKK